MTEQIKIISEPTEKNPFLIIYKDAGVPSAPLLKKTENAVMSSPASESALEQVVKLFPEIKNVAGKLQHEYGLLHRLDTATKGLLLIATTQKSYDELIDCQNKNKFEKSYKAVCDFFPDNTKKLGGFPPANYFSANNFSSAMGEKKINFVAESYFRAFGKGSREVRPVTEFSNTAAKKKSGTELYRTHIQITHALSEPLAKTAPSDMISETANTTHTEKATAICTITRGFRHQVRCHLAWNGFPVCGDTLYNALFYGSQIEAEKQELEFEAFKLKFPHPLTKEMIEFEV